MAKSIEKKTVPDRKTKASPPLFQTDIIIYFFPTKYKMSH